VAEALRPKTVFRDCAKRRFLGRKIILFPFLNLFSPNNSQEKVEESFRQAETQVTGVIFFYSENERAKKKYDFD
jgi:hypothetical protein